MILHLKYNANFAFKKIIEEQLSKLSLNYDIVGIGEVEVRKKLSSEEHKQLSLALNAYGIEIVESEKSVFVQKIKDAIVEMVYIEEKLPTEKISSYLAGKLDRRYTYLAKIFSEVTYTSIENFIIIQKIEYAKQLIIVDKLTLTEVAYKLNYSSVAHLSAQFKKLTGLTPTAFQRIIQKRNNSLAEVGNLIFK